MFIKGIDMMKKEMLFAGLIIGFVANSVLAMENHAEVRPELFKVIKITMSKAKPNKYVKAKKRPLFIVTRHELTEQSENGNMYEFIGGEPLLPGQGKMLSETDLLRCRYASEKYGKLDVIIRNGFTCFELNHTDLMYFLNQQKKIVKE